MMKVAAVIPGRLKDGADATAATPAPANAYGMRRSFAILRSVAGIVRTPTNTPTAVTASSVEYEPTPRPKRLMNVTTLAATTAPMRNCMNAIDASAYETSG